MENRLEPILAILDLDRRTDPKQARPPQAHPVSDIQLDKVRLEKLRSQNLRPLEFLAKLPSIGYVAVFDAVYLEQFLKQKSKVDRTRRQCLDVLDTGVAWFINFAKTNNLERFDLVLNCLAELHDTCVRQNAFDLFKLMFSEIITVRNDVPCKPISGALVEFYNSYPQKWDCLRLGIWLGELASVSPKDSFTDNARDLVRLMIKLTDSKSCPFNQDDGEQLLGVIHDRFDVLDLDAMRLFARLVNIAPQEQIMYYVSVIPGYIANFVKKFPVIVSMPDCSDLTETRFGDDADVIWDHAFRGKEGRVFATPLVSISELVCSIEIRDEILQRLKLITREFSAYSPIIITGFHRYVEQGEYTLSVIYAFLILAEMMNSSQQNPEFVACVTSSELFDKRVTIFDCASPVYFPLFRMRQLVYELYFKSGGEIMGFWTKFKFFPKMVSELFVFLRYSWLYEPNDVANVCGDVMRMYFQNDAVIDSEHEFFLFVEYILQHLIFAKALLENGIFVEAYCRFFFQLEFMSRAVRLLFDTLVKGDIDVTQQVSPALKDVLDNLKHNEGNEHVKLLTKCLIENAVQALRAKNELAIGLACLCDGFCELTRLAKSKDLLYLTISFFESLCWTCKITSKERVPLLLCLKSVEGQNSSHECFAAMMQLAAGMDIETLSPTFLICNAKIVRLFVEAFWSGTRIVTDLSFLSQLCKFSLMNSQKCHEAKLDLKVLQFISESITDTNIDMDKVRASLALVAEIACVVSSIQVVTQYISLFRPIRNQLICPVAIPAIEAMDEIIRSRHDIPPAYLAITKGNSYVELSKTSYRLIERGCTFTFWIYLGETTTEVPCCLMSLAGQQRAHRLEVQLHGPKIVVCFWNEPDCFTKHVATPVPTRCWTFIALSFQSVGDRLSVRSFINNKTSAFELAGWDSANFVEVICQVGSRHGGQLVRSHTVLVGSFGLFPLLHPVKLIEMSQNGPESTGPNEDWGIHAAMESENSLLCMHITQKKPLFSARLVGPPVVQPLPFADVLVRYVTIDSIIPLFAQIGLNDQTCDMGLFLNKIVDLFFDIICLAPTDLDTNLWSVNPNYSAVVYLLGTVPSKLTYELYTQFYARSYALKSQVQREQAITNLLLNPLLWCCNLDPENEAIVYKIVENWNTKLSVTGLKFGFSELLDKFVPVFWGNRQLERRELLTRIRKLAVEVIIKIVNETNMVLTRRDLNSLLQYTCGIPIQDQCIDMLELIAKLSYTKPAMMEVRNDKSLVTRLFSMISFGNEAVTFQVIKTIAVCCRNHTLDDGQSGRTHIAALGELVSPYPCSLNFLERILHEDRFLLLPIICMIASKGDPQVLSIVKANLVGNKKYCVDRTWVVWPSALGIIQESLLQPIVQFIIDSTDDAQLPSTYAMMSVTSYVMGCWNNTICREFLRCLDRRFLSSLCNEEHVALYVELCFDFLFYHWPNQSRFRIIFNKSVFGDGQEAPPKPLVNPFSQEFSHNLEGLLQTESSTKRIFGPVLDANGNWPDAELALDCLRVIWVKKLTKFYEMVSLIAYFTGKVALLAYMGRPCAEKLITCPNVDPAMKSELVRIFNIGSDVVQRTGILTVCERLMKIHDHLPVKPQNYIHEACQQLRLMNSRIQAIKSVGITSDDATVFDIWTQVKELKSQWQHLWASLILDRGPWHQRTHDINVHWKRDFSLCSPAQIPMKMKRNRCFDDHKEASFLRDTGSIAVAKQQNEEYQSEKEKLRKQNVPEIFDVKDSPEATERQQSTTTESISELRLLVKKKMKLVTMERVEDGEFLLFPERIELAVESKTRKVIQADAMKEVLLRTWLQRPVAIEIFCEYGRSYFIVFATDNPRDVDEVRSILASRSSYKKCIVQTDPWDRFFASTPLMEHWCKRRIGNFRYLMLLNKFSARSFNNASVYPLLPWVIQDYTSDTMRLNDPHFFRDLSKPVGLLGQQRLKDIRERQKDVHGHNMAMWSSYAVSPLTVYLWLVRMEPFTTLHIKMQSGKFDHASRQFASIPDSFRMVTTHLNDFRELIPEFFFQPEFLVNANGFDLGDSNGVELNDVQLPNWAHTPIEFVYLHRKALESEYVSEHLHKWIDLIWGYQQRGEEAKDAQNTYDPRIYDTAWKLDDGKDPISAKLIEASMQYCGQIPPQLFTRPHPARDAVSPKKASISTRIQTKMEIAHASVHAAGDDLGTYIVRLVTKNGRFCDCHVKPDRKNVELIEYPVSIDPACCVDVGDAGSALDPTNESYQVAVATVLGNVDVHNVQTGFVCSLRGHTGKVNCIATDKRNIATGGSDSIIQLWKIIETGREVVFQGPQKIPSFRGQILCVSISLEYNVTVAGCSDGSIFVISSESGTVTRVIDLERKAKPRKLLVTKEWGFILVCASVASDSGTEDWLYLFTINGEQIRKCKLACAVSVWTTWSSTDGFDYVLMADTEGRIHKFEAFFLEIGAQIESVASVVALYYDKFMNVALIIPSDGDIRCRLYP